ncbi:MAG: NB-ARC domain-containing protein [Chloroflexota bacterium]
MNIDDITLSLVSNTLRAWRGAEDLPAGLLALDVLRKGGSATEVERGIHLRDLIESLVITELQDQRASEHALNDALPTTRADLLQAVGMDFSRNNGELEAWSALYHRYLAPVPLSVEELATAAHLDVRNFRRRVNGGVERLTDRLQRLEMAEHNRVQQAQLGRHLPPPEYARLFGVDQHRRKLADLLRHENGPDFVSIEGMGGIGKTALARAVTSSLAENSNLDGIAWISARQTWFNDRGEIETTSDPATTLADIVSRLVTQLGYSELAGLNTQEKLDRLAAIFRSTRHLIVIDNLESISDVDILLPALMPLARPTRFLLTSRESMSRYPMVPCFRVPSLSFDDSRALVESELHRRGFNSTPSLEDMTALYELVGGAPLALKLVSSQMSRWPLAVLINDMRRASRSAPESLYTFIYRRTWMVLDDSARELLLSLLTIAPDGEDIHWLRVMSFLPPDAFDKALDQLLTYSLLQLAGLSDSLHYRLHRLTTTFLQTEILSTWQEADSGSNPEFTSE